MSHVNRIAGGAFAAALLASLPAGAEAPPSHPPAEAFGQLPAFSMLKLSPDGEHLAMLRETEGKNAVVMLPVHPKPGDKPHGITGGNQFLSGIVWLNNERLAMITKANEKAPGDDKVQTWYRALSTNLDGTEQAVMLNNLRGYSRLTNIATIIDIAPDDPQYVYMGGYTLSPIVGVHYDIYKVDVATGRGEVSTSGIGTPIDGKSDVSQNGATYAWITDGDGNPVARIDRYRHPLMDRVVIRDGSGWKLFDTFDVTGDKDNSLVGLTADKAALIIHKPNAQRADALFTHDLKTGEVKPLFDAGKYDVDGLRFDPWTGLAVGVSYTDDTTKVVYFDKRLDGLQLGLQKAFPDVSVHITSWDRARNTVLFVIEGPKQPPVYYLFDEKTKQARPIAYTYPNLKPEDLGEMKPYYYKARDGLEIPAYITLPPGKTPKMLPTVVMPHGGPDARDAIHFDWWAQFLANRGYVVLQPNFRGSAGYGKAYTEAGLKQWGLKMQDDITDGVKKLIADGIADPKRVCIVGASYGGYATLAGVTFTPDLYACGASWAGVSDLPHILSTEVEDNGGASKVVSFWFTRISADPKQQAATSPALHADQVKAPVLLMHGEGDTTVRVDQSEIEEAALKRAGKKVTFVRFTEGEDHYLNTAATRIKMLKLLEKFLDENIGH